MSTRELVSLGSMWSSYNNTRIIRADAWTGHWRRVNDYHPVRDIPVWVPGLEGPILRSVDDRVVIDYIRKQGKERTGRPRRSYT